MADGKVIIDTGLDTSGIEKDFASLGGIAKKGLSGLIVAVGAVSAALAGVGGYAISAGSDFEAGMSEVKSISGATATEVEQLTAKAKEMGAQTKFSATESAAAFKYMAMAGWETSDMLDGIEGIMNLAAASGEDLASVSDIVTDALTAFGLQASDSAHFADVLAKASSSSNTNVGLMGATFQYVAPLAGAMGYSIEDTATAIGLMANAGIKGEKAGTALRSMLTRLADPSKDAAEAMDALGISITNADGTMKPLSEVMDILRERFDGLSEAEQIEYASNLAGQEAMSGLLSIVNTAPADYQSLTDSIYNANGAAKEMSEVMQDNLKGDIVLLQSAVEGLGIQFYESMDDGLREVVQDGIGYIDQLAKAFGKDGLEGAVETAGDIFGDIAVKAAQQAPKMVDASVKFIGSFINGLSKNKGKLTKAAGDLVKTMADALIKLLPKSMQKPAKDAVEAIVKTLTGNSLKTGLDKVGNMFKALGDVIGNMSKVVLPPLTAAFDFCVSHMDLLIASLVAGVTAFKAFEIVGKVTTLIQTVTTAYSAAAIALDEYVMVNGYEAVAVAASSGALSLKTIAVGLLTGQIGLATAATNLFNMACNALGGPVGIAITIVTALATGIGVLSAAHDKGVESTERLNSETEKFNEQMGKIVTSMTEFQTQVQSADSIFDGFNESIIVSSEVQQELSNKMNTVQAEITTIARTATEERRALTQAEIDRLDELFEQMRSLAEQELAISQQYQDAVKTQAEVLAQTHEGTIEEYQQYSATILNSAEETKNQTIAKAQEQYTNEVALLRQKHEAKGTLNSQAYNDELRSARDSYTNAVNNANKECGDTISILAAGYNRRADNLRKFSATNDDINKKRESAESQHNANIKALLEKYNVDSATLKTSNFEKQAMFDYEYEAEMSRHTSELADMQAEQTATLTDETAAQAGAFLDMVTKVELYGSDLTLSCEETADGVVSAFEGMPAEARSAMDNTMQGMLNGMVAKEPALYAKATSIADGVLSRLKKAFDIRSPSKKTKKIFTQVIEGGEGGLEKEAPNLFKQVDRISGGVLDRFAGLDIGGLYSRMSNAVAAESSIMTSGVVSRIRVMINEDIPISKELGIDYDKLSSRMVEAFAKAGLTFKYNGREVARMVREVMPI